MGNKPKLLFIPHTAWEQCQAQRPWELVHGLLERFEIHVVTWASRPKECANRRRYFLNPLNHVRALFPLRQARSENPFVHRVPVPLPILQGMMKGYPRSGALLPAQFLFQRSIRRLGKRIAFDAVVAACSHHLTGYPPHFPDLPVVFDYVDTSPPHVEAEFIRNASSIVTVSHVLKDRVESIYGRNAVVIPNGFHAQRVENADGDRARARWGLRGKTVISLIGLTCSDRLYFLDAVANIQKSRNDIVFVAAGAGSLVSRIATRCRELDLPCVLTGWVDPMDVPDLFAATDIGLYPGDDNPYFDGACPLKVLEYTGAKKPVVANQVAELKRLGFSNLVLRPATSKGFEDGIRAVLENHVGHAPDISEYDWPKVTSRFGDEIDHLLASRRRK